MHITRNEVWDGNSLHANEDFFSERGRKSVTSVASAPSEASQATAVIGSRAEEVPPSPTTIQRLASRPRTPPRKRTRNQTGRRAIENPSAHDVPTLFSEQDVQSVDCAGSAEARCEVDGGVRLAVGHAHGEDVEVTDHDPVRPPPYSTIAF